VTTIGAILEAPTIAVATILINRSIKARSGNGVGVTTRAFSGGLFTGPCLTDSSGCYISAHNDSTSSCYATNSLCPECTITTSI